MVLLAHVSDIHFDGGARAADRAARVVGYLDALTDQLDAILVTGDITDHGRPDEYAEARILLSTRFPTLICPGNHDVRAALRPGLLDRPASDEPLNQVHHLAGVVVATCDTSVPGRPDGYLTDETLRWLDDVLANVGEDEYALVALHHPPVDLHSPLIDQHRQRGGERLADVLRRQPRVAGVLCGHAHAAAASTFAGVPLLVGPSVRSVVRLPWEGDGPDVDDTQPPSIAFHVLAADGRLVTHYRLVA